MLNSLLNCKQLLKFAVVSAGAFLLLAPSVKALQVNSSQTSETANIQQATGPVLLAQDNACEGKGGSMFVQAETRNFYVYICGGDLPGYYVGVAKNGSGGITLPLRSYERNKFVAVNANTRYILTRSQLLVIQNGKTILRERIISWD